MADRSGDQDRSEPATPFKLEEARKRGQVFRSVEINSLATLAVALLSLLAFGEWAQRRTMSVSSSLLVEAGRRELSIEYVHHLLEWISTTFVVLMSPLLAFVVIVGVIANLLQAGPVFSFYPLKPDFKRIHPVTGFKKLFSVRSLYEGGKALIKLAALTMIVYLIVRSQLEELMQLVDRPLRHYPKALTDLVSATLFTVLLGFFCISAIDFTYSRWEFMKQMRMSRRELKDEVKRREGDPQIRGKRRELQRALRKKAGSIRKVKDADVLITNPVHLAVALSYKRGQMAAPRVIAKGSGDMAFRMRRAAFRYGVTVVENPPLARLIYKASDIDQLIPEKSYAEVARLLRTLVKIDSAAGAK